MTLPIIPHESYTDAGAHVGHHPNHLKKPKSSSSAHHTDFSTTKSKFKHNSPTLQLAVSQTANLSHSSNHPLFISLYGAPNLPISSPVAHITTSIDTSFYLILYFTPISKSLLPTI